MSFKLLIHFRLTGFTLAGTLGNSEIKFNEPLILLNLRMVFLNKNITRSSIDEKNYVICFSVTLINGASK